MPPKMPTKKRRLPAAKMPELPEVETIRRGLARHAVGKQIEAVVGEDGRLTRNNPGGIFDLRAGLTGKTVAGVDRRGKFMWIAFEETPKVLIVHLGMSGQVHVRELPVQSEDLETRSESNRQPELGRHEHVRLVLGGGKALSFVDARTFGHLTLSEVSLDGERLVPSLMSPVARDPLEVPDLGHFLPAFLRTRRPIKSVLLDQHTVSGIGNIYADEALFSRGLHGSTPSNSLQPDQVVQLLAAARDVMLRALKVGGTSFDQFYVDVQGDPGYFERSLRVYGREGKPCPACAAPIEKEVIGGRSHFFCPQCQGATPLRQV